MGYLWDYCAVNISEDQYTVRTWVRKVWERFRRCTKPCKTNAPPPAKKKTLASKCITSYDCAWPELFFCVCVCVWKHLGTRCYIFQIWFGKNKMSIAAFRISMFFSKFSRGCRLQPSDFPCSFRSLAGGQRGWGGSLANEDAPPIPCKRTCNGKRLSQEPQQFYRNFTSTNYKDRLW